MQPKQLFLLFVLSIYGQSAFCQKGDAVVKEHRQKQQQAQIAIRSKSKIRSKLFPDMYKVTSSNRAAREELKKLEQVFELKIDTLRIKHADPSLIRGLEDTLANSTKRVESAYAISQEFIHATNKRRKVRLLPAMSTYTSSLYYNSEKQIEFFQNVNLNYFSTTGAIKTELAAAYYWIFRADISTVLSKTKVEAIDLAKAGSLTQSQLAKELSKVDSTNKSNSTLNKVISGGGEAMFTLRTPLISLFSNQRRTITPRFTSELVGNFCLDLPIAKTYINGSDATYFSMWGFDNDFSVPLIRFNEKRDGYQALALAVKVVIKNIHGSSPFYNNLGVSSKDGFWIREFYYGIDAGPVMFYYTTQTFSKGAFDRQERFGLAFNKQF